MYNAYQSIDVKLIFYKASCYFYSAVTRVSLLCVTFGHALLHGIAFNDNCIHHIILRAKKNFHIG